MKQHDFRHFGADVLAVLAGLQGKLLSTMALNRSTVPQPWPSSLTWRLVWLFVGETVPTQRLAAGDSQHPAAPWKVVKKDKRSEVAMLTPRAFRNYTTGEFWSALEQFGSVCAFVPHHAWVMPHPMYLASQG